LPPAVRDEERRLMPGLAEIKAKWETLRADGGRLGASVSLAAIAADVLADLAQLTDRSAEQTVTPKEASLARGFHVESIHRMIRAGKLTNYGTRRRPRVRLSECPQKAGAESSFNATRDDDQGGAAPIGDVARTNGSSASCSPTTLALDVLSSRRGNTRGSRSPRSASSNRTISPTT
jgi:hypothetical protein